MSHRAWSLGLLVVVSCASRTAADGAAAAPDATTPETAAAVKAAFARELEALGQSDFSTPGGFAGKVEASSAPVIQGGGEFDTVKISLGTEQTLECMLHPERIDGGGTLRRFAEMVAEKLELKALAGVDIRPIGGSPLLFAELVYLADSPAGKMAGLLKLGLLAHETHSMICTHDEPGYSQTFRRVVTGLAESLTREGEDPLARAAFAEVQICTIGETKVGYVEQALWKNPAKGEHLEAHTSHIIPKAGANFSVIDTIRTVTTDTAAVLIEDISVVVVDNQIGTQLRLASEDGGKTYTYQGTVNGEALEGSFAAKQPLTTELGRARRYAAKAGGGPAGEQRFASYEPNVNPKDATEVIYRKDAATPGQLEVGAAEPLVKVRVDEHGLFERTEFPIGKTAMICTRAFARGAP